MPQKPEISAGPNAKKTEYGKLYRFIANQLVNINNLVMYESSKASNEDLAKTMMSQMTNPKNGMRRFSPAATYGALML